MTQDLVTRVVLCIGAREHPAPYLRTESIAAHASCELRAVCTCEPPYPACEQRILPENIAFCARSVRTTRACPTGRLLSRKATSTTPPRTRQADTARVHHRTNPT